jgi:hypothetical protein
MSKDKKEQTQNRDYEDMRFLARGRSVGIGGNDYKGASERHLTHDLAIADEDIRRRKYGDALEKLEEVRAGLNYVELPEGTAVKYAKAVFKRANRLYGKIGKDSDLSERTRLLIFKGGGWGIAAPEEVIEDQRVHKRTKGLERTAVTTSIIGFIGGLFFLSSNITGNAIGSSVISNWIGAVLLIVGLVAGFFWLKSKKK